MEVVAHDCEIGNNREIDCEIDFRVMKEIGERESNNTRGKI